MNALLTVSRETATGLTPTETLALEALRSVPMTVHELAYRIHTSRRYAARILEQLQAEGLVAVVRSLHGNGRPQLVWGATA